VSAGRELPPATRAAVVEEMADVLLYLVRLADKLDVDLIEAACTKMALTQRNTPSRSREARAESTTSCRPSRRATRGRISTGSPLPESAG